MNLLESGKNKEYRLHAIEQMYTDLVESERMEAHREDNGCPQPETAMRFGDPFYQ